jgi:aminoglycoside phosphotransferase (APT) family kinase protein
MDHLEPAVCDYLARRGHRAVEVELRLEGHFSTGLSALRLERVAAVARLASGEVLEHALVLKHTSPGEAEALLALAELAPAVPELPELIASGEDEGGPWVLLPFYEGHHPPSPHAAPLEVFDALAQMHSRWEGRTSALTGVPAIDPAWWRDQSLNHTLPMLERCLERRESSAIEAAVEAVAATADDDRIARALAILPRTLVHGDMHRANIVVSGGAKIIDWGSARLAPAMLDVAEIAASGSPSEARYLDARERLDGRGADRDAEPALRRRIRLRGGACRDARDAGAGARRPRPLPGLTGQAARKRMSGSDR